MFCYVQIKRASPDLLLPIASQRHAYLWSCSNPSVGFFVVRAVSDVVLEVGTWAVDCIGARRGVAFESPLASFRLLECKVELLLLIRCGVWVLLLLYDSRKAVPNASRDRGVADDGNRNRDELPVILSNNDLAAGVNESSLDAGVAAAVLERRS